ncbi:MAG: peptidylprolyl isomerase [Candidatus Berkelbacteria bacterium]|nr:peptidylprolyl isomerase [Candidatus Berkelbacteria bacterium]
MKKILIVCAAMFLSIILSGCAEKATAPENGENMTDETAQVSPQSVPSEGKYSFPGILPNEKIKNKKAVIKTKKGVIEFELYSEKAPKTVSNFVYLTEAGFFNGLTFHRVVPGFVIQGGDPQGTGAGGPGYEFEDEAVQGEYTDGAVAMANSGPNTNGSQFFICLGAQPTLSKDYNLFGQVTKGLDVTRKIVPSDVMESVTIENK